MGGENITGTPGEQYRALRRIFDITMEQCSRVFDISMTTQQNWEKHGPRWSSEQRQWLLSIGVNPMFIDSLGPLIIPGRSFESAKREIRAAAGLE